MRSGVSLTQDRFPALADVAKAATASQSIFHSVRSHLQFLRQLVRQPLKISHSGVFSHEKWWLFPCNVRTNTPFFKYCAYNSSFQISNVFASVFQNVPYDKSRARAWEKNAHHYSVLGCQKWKKIESKRSQSKERLRCCFFKRSIFQLWTLQFFDGAHRCARRRWFWIRCAWRRIRYYSDGKGRAAT